MKYLRKKSFLNFPLSVLCVFLISSCASIPDVPICQELSPDRAFCVTTVSGKKFEINDTNLFENKTWWDQRHQMIRVPVSSWAEIKKSIIKMCKKYKCDKDISSWDRVVDTIDQIATQPN